MDEWWLSQFVNYHGGIKALQAKYPEIIRDYSPKLSVDLWAYVLSFVAISDVNAVLRTCKTWNRVQDQGTFWYRIGLKRFKDHSGSFLKYYNPNFKISEDETSLHWIFLPSVYSNKHVTVFGDEKNGFFYFQHYNNEYLTNYFGSDGKGYSYHYFSELVSLKSYSFTLDQSNVRVAIEKLYKNGFDYVYSCGSSRYSNPTWEDAETGAIIKPYKPSSWKIIVPMSDEDFDIYMPGEQEPQRKRVKVVFKF